MSDEVNLSFAKTFAHSVQRRSISLKSFEYTDKIWSNSQVLKILTVKRDKKQMKNIGTDCKNILVSLFVLINVMI